MSKIKKKNFWIRLWKLISPSKKKIRALFVLIFILEISRLISPYILKLIIDKLISFKPENISLIIFLIILMFLSSQFNSLFTHLQDKKIFSILIDIEYYLPVKIHRKLMNLSLSYHEKENTGNKITKIERGVSKITNLLGNVSWEIIPTLMKLALTLIILFIVDWRFGISYAIFSPLFIFLSYKANKDLYPIRKQRHKNYEIASGKMGQAIININTVKSFVQEKNETKKFSQIRENIKISELKEWHRLLNFSLLRKLVIDLGRMVIMFLGVYFVWSKSITVGTLIFVITLSEKAYSSLWRLSHFYDKIEDGAEAVSRFMRVFNEPIVIKNSRNGFKPKKN